jgi:hypothetical protein
VSDIFLSYSREDWERATKIAKTFEMHGYSVWWDQNIPPGKRYEEYILEKLNQAKCVLVLWSKNSVKSDWVKDEADWGRKREILVPVLIDDVDIPLGFGQIQTAGLMNWRGKVLDPGFSSLLMSVGDTIGKLPKEISESKTAERKQKAQEGQTRLAGIAKKKKIYLPEASLPLVDLTSHMTPIRDQGNEGCSVGFPAAAALEYQIYKKHKKKVIISPQYIYYLAKIEGKSDPLLDTGAFNKDAVKILKTKGAILEDVWPYNPENFKTVPIDQINRADKYKITHRYQLTTVEEIKSAIQQYGPVVIGIPTYNSISKASKTGMVPDPVLNDKTLGGHAVCIVGYDDDKKLFKFRNSWGNKWGARGYGYLSYDYVKNYSRDNWIFWI